MDHGEEEEDEDIEDDAVDSDTNSVSFSRLQSCPWLALLPSPSAPQRPRLTLRPTLGPSSTWEPWPFPPSPAAPSLTDCSSARSHF